MTTTYKKAFEELEQIAESLENDQIEIDDLAKKIKRAKELVNICKDKLYKIEQDIDNELKEK